MPVLVPDKLEADAFRPEVDEFRAELARKEAIEAQVEAEPQIPDYVPANWTL